MIINRIYENQNLLSLQLFSFLVGLRTYQHPCNNVSMNSPQNEKCSSHQSKIKTHISIFLPRMSLLLVFSHWAGLGKDQSAFRRLVCLWYAASCASSQGYLAIAFPPRFRYSHFRHQVPPRPPQRERSQRRKVELWARMLSGNFAEMTTSTPFKDLLHAANLRHGTDGFTFPPKEDVLRIFSPNVLSLMK